LSTPAHDVVVCVDCGRRFEYVRLTKPRKRCVECATPSYSRSGVCERCGAASTPSRRYRYCEPCRRAVRRERDRRRSPRAENRNARRLARLQLAPLIAEQSVDCGLCDRPVVPDGVACPVCASATCGWHVARGDDGKYEGAVHACCANAARRASQREAV